MALWFAVMEGTGALPPRLLGSPWPPLTSPQEVFALSVSSQAGIACGVVVHADLDCLISGTAVVAQSAKA
eukprot:8110182-Pyramimonas_sp.AAC.1